MTPDLIRNEPLEYERTVVGSVTRNKVSCRYGVIIDNRDPTTIIHLTMINILLVLGWIAVVDLLI